MRRASNLVMVAFGLLALALTMTPAAYAADDAGAPAPALPACVRVSTQTRWVPYGYNHVVMIENGCSKPATCKVSTDVNPQIQTAEVPSAQTVEILTITASPASAFVAKVTCSLH